ncbi:MAG: SIMPL domain-containing protein [Parvibaculaceae bacterium]
MGTTPIRRTGFRFPLLGACLLAVLAALPLAGAAQAEDTQRTITVSGRGEISVRPDIAYVETGVVSEAKTAVDALTANTQAMQAVFRGLKEMGIAENDIRTSQFSVSATYTRPERGEAARISGYQASNIVTVTIRDLDRVGEALDRLVGLGSNQLRGIRFAVEKPEPLLEAARADAVKDALRKAKIYIGAAGVALGPILSINENGGGGPQPLFARTMAMESADVPVAPGEQTLSAGVTLVIEIQ